MCMGIGSFFILIQSLSGSRLFSITNGNDGVMSSFSTIFFYFFLFCYATSSFSFNIFSLSLISIWLTLFFYICFHSFDRLLLLLLLVVHVVVFFTTENKSWKTIFTFSRFSFLWFVIPSRLVSHSSVRPFTGQLYPNVLNGTKYITDVRLHRQKIFIFNPLSAKRKNIQHFFIRFVTNGVGPFPIDKCIICI